MDYSVEGMATWLAEQKRNARQQEVETLSNRDAVATVMLVTMIYKYAMQVKEMGVELKRPEFKSLGRRIDGNVRAWRQVMREILDNEHQKAIESAIELLEQEQAMNLTQLFFSCKNEIDKVLRENDTEIRAYAWRVVLLVNELSKWFYKKLPKRFGSISRELNEIRSIMKDYAGTCVDTSRYKNTELCMIIFDRALESIELEYVNIE